MFNSKFLIVLCVLCTAFSQDKISEKDLYGILKGESVSSSIKQMFSVENVNNPLESGYTPLIFSIKKDPTGDGVKTLLDIKADPNLKNGHKTPLMYAAKYKKNEYIKLLHSYGAYVNQFNKKGVNALMYAIRYKNVKGFKLLIESGADPKLKNKRGYNAIDFAKKMNIPEILKELKISYKSQLNTDGPYVLEKNDNYESIHVQNGKVIKNKLVNGSKIEISVDGSNESFTLNLQNRHVKPSDTYDEPNKLLAISDLEGNFYAFSKILKGNNIIDKDFNWTFGDGHIVVIGDVFDRGKNVLPCLWLLYKLDYQAKKSGGQVHFILGNHEVMNLFGKTDYVESKYLDLANKLDIHYAELFGKSTVLGDWIRTKNVVERIGENVYAHGGLSVQAVKNNYSISKLNLLASAMINDFRKSRESKEIRFVFEKYGPLWFRGYFRNPITAADMEKITSFYNVKRVVVGHTIVDDIETRLDKKVVAIDLKHPRKGSKQDVEALYIEDKMLYVINDKGVRSAL